MKILKYLGIFLVLTLSIVSCNNGDDAEKEAKLEEAGKLHDGALALGNETNKMLKNAKSNIERINSMMSGLDAKTQEEVKTHIKSLAEAKEDYDVWQKSLVEVPGHAHAHHEGEGHNHNHDHSMDNASPDDIVAKQKDLKEFIENINKNATEAYIAIQAIIDGQDK